MVAPIVAAAGIVTSFLAVQFIHGGLDPNNQFNGYGSFLSSARVGFWFAVAGFLLVGIGGTARATEPARLTRRGQRAGYGAPGSSSSSISERGMPSTNSTVSR